MTPGDPAGTRSPSTGRTAPEPASAHGPGARTPPAEPPAAGRPPDRESAAAENSGPPGSAAGSGRARGTLAEQQAALVRALVTGAPPPPGFDAGDLDATAHALLHKRAGDLARRFPVFAHACGPDFTALFLAWARTRPKVSTAADAAAFAAHLGVPPPAIRRFPRFGR
ncbi:hypothetical protein [Nocardia sp. NPDC057668]|uniref:hypothetical protein n=1 Tax=Nocardia sp. NPDC057668 TaxID=3346202 RepID=UPI00366FA0B6